MVLFFLSNDSSSPKIMQFLILTLITDLNNLWSFIVMEGYFQMQKFLGKKFHQNNNLQGVASPSLWKTNVALPFRNIFRYWVFFTFCFISHRGKLVQCGYSAKKKKCELHYVNYYNPNWTIIVVLLKLEQWFVCRYQ